MASKGGDRTRLKMWMTRQETNEWWTKANYDRVVMWQPGRNRTELRTARKTGERLESGSLGQ